MDSFIFKYFCSKLADTTIVSFLERKSAVITLIWFFCLMNVSLIHQENCTVPISHLWCVLCILRLCISHLSPPLPMDYRIKNILELHRQSQCLTFSSSEFSFCGILSILTSYPLLLFVNSDSWAPFFVWFLRVFYPISFYPSPFTHV